MVVLPTAFANFAKLLKEDIESNFDDLNQTDSNDTRLTDQTILDNQKLELNRREIPSYCKIYANKKTVNYDTCPLLEKQIHELCQYRMVITDVKIGFESNGTGRLFGEVVRGI